jgi:arabinogalactan oligomer/maltooligosaccharide transport system permease protein
VASILPRLKKQPRNQEAARSARRQLFNKTARAWLYIAPAGLLMAVITFFPQLYQAWMAFTDYRITNLRFNIFNPETWEKFAPAMVGLSNFAHVLTSNLPIEDYDFIRLLKFNLAWTVANVFFHVIIGVAIAIALNSKDLVGRRFYRAIFVLPWAIPGLIIAFTWRNMYDRRFGAINQLIGKVNEWLHLAINNDIRWLETTDPPAHGLLGLALGLVVLLPLVLLGINALLRSKYSKLLVIFPVVLLAWILVDLTRMYMGLPFAFWAVWLANVWLGWPFMTVIATGALQSIPGELYEAARMDGASGWQQLVNITIPMLRSAMLPAIMVGTIWTFNNFNIIFFISQGGPFGRTELLVTQAYKLVFTQRLYGIAAAFSIVVFFVLLIITLIQNRVTSATKAYYE